MFLRLGVLNVRRQLGRSALVIITLALAAISLTYSLSYRHITPPRIANFLDDFVGGEILVAPVRWAGQQVSDVTGNATYYYSRLTASGMSWLEWFYPELYSDGLWSRKGTVPVEFFTQDDVKQLAAYPGIAEANVTPFLPVVLQTRDDNGEIYLPLAITPENERLEEFARIRVPGDLRKVNLRGILLNQAMDTPRTTHRYEEGDQVQLWLPQVAADGSLQLNRDTATMVELPFVNYGTVPTRSVSWMGPVSSLVMEEGRFRAAVAWVDQDTWSQLLQQSGVEDHLPVANLALRLSDPQQLSTILAELSQAFPDLTFLHVGAVEDRVFLTGHLELFEQAPKSVYSSAEKAGLVVPDSFNRILGLIFLLIAGLLLGGHMLTSAAARHQEIGTLRALGARRRDILLLGISEAVTTTFIGATSGFLILRLYGAMMELRGGQPLLQVLSLMLTEYAMVLGLALLASLTFATFPIWRLARLAPMEVLRNE